MAYAMRLNGKQRACIKQYESLCGFEFMYQDDIDSGEMTFKEAWVANVRWLENVVADITSIQTQGACAYNE